MELSLIFVFMDLIGFVYGIDRLHVYGPIAFSLPVFLSATLTPDSTSLNENLNWLRTYIAAANSGFVTTSSVRVKVEVISHVLVSPVTVCATHPLAHMQLQSTKLQTQDTPQKRRAQICFYTQTTTCRLDCD